MKKIKLKKKKKFTIITIILVLIITTVFVVINYFSKKIKPSLFSYAELETKKISNMIINNAISKTVTDKLSPEEIFSVVTDKNDDIKSIDFNTVNINKYLTKATKSIQNDLKNIEKGNTKNISPEIKSHYNKEDLKKGIIYYVSSGLLIDNPLLANLGPKVPVKISLAGDVISYVSAEVTDYGINNSLIKVFINLKVTEKVILPFFDKNIDMEAKVPIAIKLVAGTIPEYYFGTNNKNKKIIIPN